MTNFSINLSFKKKIAVLPEVYSYVGISKILTTGQNSIDKIYFQIFYDRENNVKT